MHSRGGGLDEGASDFAFALGVGRHGAVGEQQGHGAVLGEVLVVDDGIGAHD